MERDGEHRIKPDGERDESKARDETRVGDRGGTSREPRAMGTGMGKTRGLLFVAGPPVQFETGHQRCLHHGRTP